MPPPAGTYADRVRRVVVGVLVVVVLAGAAWLADGWARARAEDRIATELVTALELPAAPEVAVAGPLFLPQLWSGRLTEVTATADDVPLGRVRLREVVAVAHGVTAEQQRADAVDVTGTVPVTELARLLAEATGLTAEVVVVGDAVVLSGELLGAVLELDLVPRAQDGRVLVDATVVRLGDLELPLTMLPGDLASRVQGIEIPLDGLPAGLAVTGVAVRPDGVAVTLAGTDVTLAR